jgi:hypothetical protein
LQLLFTPLTVHIVASVDSNHLCSTQYATTL